MKRGFFFGVILGIIAGLLLAPKRGEELRDEVCERFTELRTSTINPAIQRIKERSSQVIEDGKQKVSTLQNGAVAPLEEQTATNTAE